MEKILSSLYEVVCEEATKLSHKGIFKEAFQFEDKICGAIKFSAEKGIYVSPPREILNLPTFSGNKYQVDCFFTYNKITYAVECKRRQITTRDQIYYFNSILLDYVLGLKVHHIDHFVKGIFISTAPIDDNSLKYCIVYAITVIHPDFPPIEYMLSKAADENLKRALMILQEKLPHLNPLFKEGQVDNLHRDALNLLDEYKYLIGLWKVHRGG
jgi:hypothetical protein